MSTVGPHATCRQQQRESSTNLALYNRNGSFEPVLVPKGVRRLDGLNTNVIPLYAKGMSTGDIQTYLAESYDTEISRDTISRITDAILGDMTAWQNRPLDRVYPVLLIDAIYLKIRDGQVANRQP